MHGSCLCKSVRYRIDRLDGPIVHCHCLTCQKAHAAAFATTAGVERRHFRWTAGDDVRAAYESSPGKLRHFCSRCGSHLMAEWRDQPRVIVRVSTLDEDPGLRPQRRIWRAHDRAWLAHGDDVPAFDGSAPADV